MPAKRRKRTRLPLHGGRDKPVKRTPSPKRKLAPKRPPKKGPKKRKKAPSPKRKATKRKPAKAPKRPKAPKRKGKPPKALKRKGKPPKAPKRAPPKKRSSKKRRSEAVKKGHATRRKKKKLLEAMADLRERRAEQPPGWVQRRGRIREIDGDYWREIAVEYVPDEYEQWRLAQLEDLEIDLLTRDELADYLGWLAEETGEDISDVYRMYLGYPVGESE